MGFGSGILKTAKAVFGVFKKLIFFNSFSEITVSRLASILKELVVYNCCKLKWDAINSLIVLTPSATNNPCCSRYFFCFKLFIFFFLLLDNIQTYLNIFLN